MLQQVLSVSAEFIAVSFALLVIHQFIGGLFVRQLSVVSSLPPSPLPLIPNSQFPIPNYATLDWVKPVCEVECEAVDVVAIAKLSQMKVAELRKLGSQHQIKGAARMNKQPLVSAIRSKMV